ncbi:MAG: exonuclease SbcCD subunit D, partial [Pseudothermotoga sp.]
MKILHTSDWHVGLQSWAGSKAVDRLEETRQALHFLVDVAEKERVDLVLIAGDVIHSRVNPRIDALSVLSEVMVKFSRIAPTFLVFGNHDWQGLNSWKNFQLKNLHIIERPATIELDDVVLSFLPHADYQRFLDIKKDPVARMREFLDSYLDEFRRRINPSKANVLVAHAMLEGCFESERENAILYELKPGSFPTGFDYVALGHVHSQMQILQQPIGWYCGSPIALDFGEEKDVKGALLVEISERIIVRRVRTPHVTLKTFEYEDYSLSNLNKLESELENFSGYARVLFRCVPSNEVRKHLLERYESVVKVEFETGWQQHGVDRPVEKKSLIEMYRDYVRRKYPDFEE